MFIKLPKVFYDPDDSNGTGISDNLPDLDTNDLDILNQEDDTDDDEVSNSSDDADEEGENKEKGKGKSKRKTKDESDDDESDGSEDEVDDLEEDQDDDEENDDPDDEDDDEFSGDLIQDVKKASPDLFKKLPQLREVLKEYDKFIEIVPTVEDAQIAVKNAGFLRQMYNDVSSGDVDKTSNFLKAIKETNPTAFEDFSHTILGSIAKISPDLYGQVLMEPVSKALKSMYAAGIKAGNKNLAAAAIWAYDHFFDTKDIKSNLEPRKKITEETEEQKNFKKEKQEFETTALTTFKTGVVEVVNHSMALSIKKQLDGIEMSEYQKRNIVRDIFQLVDANMGNDKRYMASVDSLFNQARSGKYNADWKTRIVKNYLQRGRQVLNPIVIKVLKEAGIKGKPKQQVESRRIVPAGLGGGRSEQNKIDVGRIDKSKTSDMDVLNDKITYKK